MISTVLPTLLGFGLIIFVVFDVNATILRATKHPGPLSEYLNRGFWRIAILLTRNLSRRWRHRILTAVGPVLLPILIAQLVLLLVTGFALIYLPQLETGFKIDQATRTGNLVEAFYFSGITLLTIGYGDVVPVDGMMRLLALLEGTSGIAVISLGVTYLVTVYGALEKKRAVALAFYHQAGKGADVPGFITLHFARGQFYDLTETIKTATRDLQSLLETHLEHPVIHYFHPLEVYKGLPRVLFVMLETITILRSCLNRESYVETDDHPSILMAESTIPFVLNELLTSLDLEKKAGYEFESKAEETSRRRRCFNRARRHLRQAGIELRPDAEQSFADYAARRELWEAKLYWFADFLGYDWDELTGDRDLADATDDEIEERHEQIAEPRSISDENSESKSD